MTIMPVRVGVVGCGAIGGAYLAHARAFPILDVVAVADLDRARAEAKAAEFGVPRVLPVDDLLRDPSIEVVLNLTVPRAHADVSLRALAAGKHVFGEKPLAVSVEEGRLIADAARRRGLRVGCAPDTFLGSGQQTARKVIDDGLIGRPVAFTAFMMGPGHESWHPSPAFYYEAGGGPMLDMGPYYLTALMNLFGPVRRVTGTAWIAIPDRVITSRPLSGTRIRVEVPDHVCGTIEFDSGVSGVIVTSFATRFPVHDERQPITVWGTEGAMRVPDPNVFDGPVHVRRQGDGEWREASPASPLGYGRAVGLADLAHALRANRPHRASLEQALHALEAMEGVLTSAHTGLAARPETPYTRPAPMPQRASLLLD